MTERSRILEFAAGVAIAILGAGVAIGIFVAVLAPDIEDVQRACRGHGGVQQVTAPWNVDADVLVVCKDGTVRNPSRD